MRRRTGRSGTASRKLRLCLAAASSLWFGWSAAQGADLGAFSDHGDVGKTSRSGSVRFDAVSGTYFVAGGGENMWFTNDAFHFVWTRVSGDFSLSASPAWPRAGGNAHRKACLMVRQSLDAGSAYVDVAIHGDGLTSLQFREAAGGPTREIQANVKRPARAGIVRRGTTYYLALPAAGSPADGALAPAGAFMRLALKDPLYVGLAVCAHDDGALEEASFARVKLEVRGSREAVKPVLHSSLEVVPIGSK